MSLEVDGRSGDVPISYQRDSEGLVYHGLNTYKNPSNTQSPSATGTVRDNAQPNELSKPKDLAQGGRVRVRPRFIFCWGTLFALVSILAIVAAGVAGSIAVRRGNNLDTWSVLAFPAQESATFKQLTPKPKHVHVTTPQRDPHRQRILPPKPHQHQQLNQPTRQHRQLHQPEIQHGLLHRHQ